MMHSYYQDIIQTINYDIFMKLEHKKQDVAPIGKFIVRMMKYFYFAIVVIVFSISLGIAGYSYYGNLPLVDSFHMASMILTGMGPVEVMKSDSAKIFSSLYALYSGIAFLSITAVIFAPIIHRLLHILHMEDDRDPR